ncbi:MAG: hypothetical protein GEU83_17475 [Pseudonocardiaceae bacterium]|nr:hypothetical protein [Pseudonocardiaceae bacterium]
MTQRPEWAPSGVDLDRPNAGRVYDYYLGGSHNVAADREMAREAIELWPELPLIMNANRAFLRRAVRYCVAQGMRQFLDIGSGIPTVGNVHEVAQAAAPEARVVYVDINPVAVMHSRAILEGDPQTGVVQADLREPDAILGHPEVRALIDFDQPLAVLLVALLHFVPDGDDPIGLVGRLTAPLRPGSHLVISHASRDSQSQRTAEHQALYSRTSTPMTMRTRAQIEALFGGLELVEPGVVFLPQWRPESSGDVESHPERFTGLAGVAAIR